MTWQVHGWEALKLVAQLAGAIFVAWLAVRLALSRFKSEKVWERQLAAHADILSALAELRRLYGRSIDEMEGVRHVTDEARAEETSRFKAAQRRIDDAEAVAALFLPAATREVLTNLEAARERVSNEQDAHSFYCDHYGLLDDAITHLVREGRKLVPR